MKEVPKFQVGEKIGFLIGESFMRFVRLLLLFERSLARVLYFQSGSDNQDLTQAVLFVRCPDDPGDPGIDRQLRIQSHSVDSGYQARVLIEPRAVELDGRLRAPVFLWFQNGS